MGVRQNRKFFFYGSLESEGLIYWRYYFLIIFIIYCFMKLLWYNFQSVAGFGHAWDQVFFGFLIKDNWVLLFRGAQRLLISLNKYFGSKLSYLKITRIKMFGCDMVVLEHMRKRVVCPVCSYESRTSLSRSAGFLKILKIRPN